MPNGTQATSPEMFGDSWVVDETGCKTEEANPCQDFGDILLAEDLCYIIKDPEGPFQECNKFVGPELLYHAINPELYYDACVYDACATLPDEDVICADIAVYAEACRQAGHPPDSWRNDDFCPLPCPDPAYYSPCAPECPETCAGYSEGPLCDSCREGCVCPAGFVWDNFECVPKDQCGCLHEEQYYSGGARYVNEDCSEVCSCHEGKLNCTQYGCSEFADCKIQNGVRDCYCQKGYSGDGQVCKSAPGVCTVWGDPHYITFDGLKYDYQGDCDYTLVKDCINSTDLPSLHLTVRNNKRKPSNKVAYTQELHLEYAGTLFSLLRGTEVRLDGTTVALPLYHPSGVAIRDVGSLVVS
ncbi:zonadhesin-like [Amphiura filiformis]|uniref:zonadhesin-like n=1 Tax=Amphiura filiformis TaxID=82378 RepID=UPI003B228DE6